MKIARNLATRTTSIALPGRSVYLSKQGSGKGSRAPLSDSEALTGPVLGLSRTRKIVLSPATDQDKADFPDFDEKPNAGDLAVARRHKQLDNARLRAAGKSPVKAKA